MLNIRAKIVLKAACRFVPISASTMNTEILEFGHPVHPWRIVLSNTRLVSPSTSCWPLKSPAGKMMEKSEWVRTEWMIMKNSFAVVFSDVNRMISRRKLAINSAGMKTGLRTCQTV